MLSSDILFSLGSFKVGLDSQNLLPVTRLGHQRHALARGHVLGTRVPRGRGTLRLPRQSRTISGLSYGQRVKVIYAVTSGGIVKEGVGRTIVRRVAGPLTYC